jgi:thioredoxin reductase
LPVEVVTMTPKTTTGTDRDDYDVVVVGGGAAGLSGALTLARARRSVLVVDAGEPRNAPAAGVHNYLGREGMSPLALLETGRGEVRSYGGEVIDGRVESAVASNEGFAVTLGDGRLVSARRLLVTTGLLDELPDVDGLRERWGRDVIHCPYCHGWEVRDQPIGVLASGPFAAHQALLFSQWTDDLTLFRHTAPAPADDQLEQLDALGVRIVAGAVTGVVTDDDRLTGLRLADGTVVPLQAVVVGPRFAARADALVSLGLEVTENEFGTFVAADAMGLTAVPGVWVAGNVTDPRAQVIGAAAAGVGAAAAINADLIRERSEGAVTARRAALAVNAPAV